MTSKVEIIRGISVSLDTMTRRNIDVLVAFTSDECGETLSLCDTATQRQIILPHEDVARLIDHTRREWESKEEGNG